MTPYFMSEVTSTVEHICVVFCVTVMSPFITRGSVEEANRRNKRWPLYILPQYLANLTQPISQDESHFFAVFVPALMTLCMLCLKI